MSNDIYHIGGNTMTSKLKQRRMRRLRDDVAWWMAEAQEWKQIALEHADKLAEMRQQMAAHHKQ
ncbi:hypothetical protein [Phytobacter diazotrophicus]|uniref:hypothetical protein n=1 Tax=Phytobacter diazotrophicus TaxID=395631 RepID=UPI002935BA17|nr:hypothetical protein [Phytobacter diazotrophicus]MDV2874454.1 hypothetical protein [Phytobacter diazotrophicus]